MQYTLIIIILQFINNNNNNNNPQRHPLESIMKIDLEPKKN